MSSFNSAIRRHTGCLRRQELKGLRPETLPEGTGLRLKRFRWRLLLGLGLLVMLVRGGCPAAGQTQGVWGRQLYSISGVVTDPSGAVVRGAAIVLMSVDPAAEVSRTVSGAAGGYRLRVDPGIYTLVVIAKGFARFESEPLQVGITPDQGMAPAAQGRTLDVALKLEMEVERVDVREGTERDNRTGNALVLSAEQIHEMPEDSTALLMELQGLAGGGSPTIYVDGFSGTKLPARDDIRQIRINQNAYSAENDTDPVDGVIEVSSRPGTNQLHGEAYVYGNDSALNASNPFAPHQPAYYAYGMGGAMSGALNQRASYYAGLDQLRQQVNSAVDAQTLDAKLNQMVVASPRTALEVTPRVDVRRGASSTMSFRYAFDRTTQTNGGVGQLALASQGFQNDAASHTIRLSNTQLIGARVVNETRFQYVRMLTSQTPVSSDPAILVQGEFLGGGNDLGAFRDHQDKYEVQNYVSLEKGMHSLFFGGRLRVGRDANHSEADFNGEYIFSSLSAYESTMNGRPSASQFHRTIGSPDTLVQLADAGLFVQDDWKLRDNLVLSSGLRFETQNGIADNADWAPRVAFSWGFGGSTARNGSKGYVLHAGAGVFYQRFSSDSMLQVARQNGVTLEQYVIPSPQFCPANSGASTQTILWCPSAPTTAAELAGQAAAPTLYRVDPAFRSPYSIVSSVSLERRLGQYGSMSVAYMNNRGEHTQLTENVNAPLPGSYDPGDPKSGVRPAGSNQNVYEYVSRGVYRSSRFSASATVNTSHFEFHGTYMLRYASSNAENNGLFPSNAYNLGADYGRSLDDVRHAGTITERVKLPWGFRAWSYQQITSGAPFNVVVGQDLNGDTQYNDRPAFATDLTRSSVVNTRWGAFDANPIAGQTLVPRNYCEGPGLIEVDLAAGRSFGVGPKMSTARVIAGSGPQRKRYTVDFWVHVLNVLNHPNLTAPVEVLNSALFGHSTGLIAGSSLSPDRSFDLQLSMHF